MKTNMFFMVLLFFGTYSATLAQTCNCDISQVKNNTVQPCNTIIGNIVNVSTVSQFKQAISQANNSGGNVTILIADGVYQVADPSSYPYITASNIVIRSQSGNRDACILEGTGMIDVLPATVTGLSFQGNNCTVADLTIRNVGSHGISANGDNIYVHNVRFLDIREQMFKGTGSGDGSDNGTIQCSLFEYSAGIGPQFYIGGIDIHQGDTWLVRDNVFRNIASPSQQEAEHAIHFWRTGSDITIERNEIVNCDRGIGFGLGNDPANGITGGIIRNNTIYNNGNFPFDDVGIGLEYSPDTKVYNNTIHIQHQNAIEYRWPATTNVDIANNLTNKPITSRDGGTANIYSNYTQAQASWYVNPTNGDLRLSGSPGTVVDQGVTLADVQDDLDQTTRPSGAAYDIGAHEVGNQPPPPSTPNCNCTVAEVKNNTVQPCNFTVGNIVNVSTAAQFKQAISQANSSGGNMTILLADGIYQVADATSYPYVTASNIVVRSASGNRDAVILEGNGMSQQPTTVNGIFFTGNNSVIADLTIRNVGNHAIQVTGDYLYVHNVRLVDIFEQMIKGASSGDGADNGRIQCSLFEYTAGIGPQWYIGGIDIHKGDNWVVNDNIFRDIASPSFAIAEHAIHFRNFGSNNTIERNEIFNCDRGIGFGLGADPAGVIGGIIRNNIVFNEGVDPFHDVGIILEQSPDTKIYNNTIHVQYQNAIEYRFAATSNAVIANNLTNKPISSRDGGTANVYSNYTQAQASWYVNPTNGDLRLSGSPGTVVDQGVTLADVQDDLDQTTRPSGAAYDIGAHEVGNQPPPPSTPNCNCTVAEVKNNTVQPCNFTVGNIVNVSTVTQFKQAIAQANSTGGNMTILMADGVYRIADVNSYPYVTASNLVIRSVSGNRDACILEGDGMVDNNPITVNGFYFKGNNCVVADLTIRNVGNHGIQTDGDYIYVHNVRFVDIYEQMFKGSSGGDGADNGQIQCSLFEYTAGIGPNWYIGGIDVHEGDNWIVRDNVFRDIASPFQSIAEHAVHFWRTGSNITVERNEIVNCDRGVGYGLGNDPANGIVGGIIRNNTIYNEGIDPFHDIGIGLEYSPDTKVYNNTVFVQSFRAIEYRWSGTTNADIANNLTNKVIGPRDGGTANVYSNYEQAQASWFVDVANGDLRLSGSPSQVVDQGVALSDVSVDLDQTPRPNGAAYDLGAHETGQSTTQTEVNLALWLEGALYTANQYLSEMKDDLYVNGLLPGQTPISPTVPPTPAGHPYTGIPWNYGGTEGSGWTDSDYQSITNQTGQSIIDWILVSFRSGPNKSTELAKVAALLLQNGTVHFPFKDVFNQPFPGPVYVLVEHRNHMGAMTANPIPTINGVLNIDFRQNNSYQNGGFGQKEISPGVWAMYGGDGDQSTDGPGYEITGKDRILWSQNNGLFSLYSNTDFTMDLDISGFDKAFWSINNGIFSNIER